MDMEISTVYRCRKCRQIVATEANVRPHSQGAGEEAFSWKKRSGKSSSDNDVKAECSSIFVEPMQWMNGVQDGNVEGKLLCSVCQARLGSFNWAGLQCSCGAWVNPAFQLHKARLDAAKPVVHSTGTAKFSLASDPGLRRLKRVPAVADNLLRGNRARFNPVKALFGFGRKTATKTVRETVIPDPDYRIPVVLLGSAGALIYTHNYLAAAPLGFLGLLLLVQTTRVRFVFDDEALEVKVGQSLKESGENVFVGGKNRWKYSTFVNWELWWPSFPILVYFKETQTKPEGQVHFFPVIFNGKQLYDVMVERAGPSKTSAPSS